MRRILKTLTQKAFIFNLLMDLNFSSTQKPSHKIDFFRWNLEKLSNLELWKFLFQCAKVNPYLVHFGNIQERHLWKKNPKFTFWSLMTSYMVEYLWRHINLKLHQLGYLYVTWPESRDVISGRYHVMKLITPENPGNELASFLEKKSRRVWERLGASFLEKLSI